MRMLARLLACGLLLAPTWALAEVPLPATVIVPAGPFLAGSSPAERAYAQTLDAGATGSAEGKGAGRYEAERPQTELVLDHAFAIMLTPVTNRDYARFLAETGHPAPDVDASAWQRFRPGQPFAQTRRHAWPGDRPPPDRLDHPVVLVDHHDAEAYAAWLARTTGLPWRLPTELEWEKAARGPHGAIFPWGNAWDPEVLNSQDQGPQDTMPVGSFLAGGSVYGMLDAAGEVYQWTATAAPGGFLVKGGSWHDQGCGACRPAARQVQPAELKHILIGFRLAHDHLPVRESR